MITYKVKLKTAITEFPCGYAGKEGALWSFDKDGTANIILTCGHPLSVRAESIGNTLAFETGFELSACPVCGVLGVLESVCLSRLCIKRREREVQIKKHNDLIDKTNRIKERKRQKAEAKLRSICSEGKAMEVIELPEEIKMAKHGVDNNGNGNGNGNSNGNGGGNGGGKSLIPGKGGAVPISGLEKLVAELRIKHAYLAVLEAEVEEMKETFRDHATRLWEDMDADSRAKEFRFIGDEGAIVSVNMPNEEADSTRKVISDSLTKQILKLGINVPDLGLTEMHEEMTLSGEWLNTVRAIVDQYYVQQGIPVPAGLNERKSTKLMVGAFDQLRSLRDAARSEKEAEAYTLLLSGGKKAAMVKVE